MAEAANVAVLVLTVAQAAVADAEKVAVVADTVAEAEADVRVDVKVVAVAGSVIFLASAVKIVEEAMPVEHAVKAAKDADAFNRIKSKD